MLKKLSLLSVAFAVVGCSPDLDVNDVCPFPVGSQGVQLIYDTTLVNTLDVPYPLLPEHILLGMTPTSAVSADQQAVIDFFTNLIVDNFQVVGTPSDVISTDNPLDYLGLNLYGLESDIDVGLPGPNGNLQEARRSSSSSLDTLDTCTFTFDDDKFIAFDEDEDDPNRAIIDFIEFPVASFRVGNTVTSTTDLSISEFTVLETFQAAPDGDPPLEIEGFSRFETSTLYTIGDYVVEGYGDPSFKRSYVRLNDGFAVLILTDDIDERYSEIEYHVFDSFCDTNINRTFDIIALNLNLFGTAFPWNFTSIDPNLDDGEAFGMCDAGVNVRTPARAACSAVDANLVEERRFDVGINSGLKRIRLRVHHDDQSVEIFTSQVAGSAVMTEGSSFIDEPTFCELQDFTGSTDTNVYLSSDLRYFDPGYDDVLVLNEETNIVTNTDPADPAFPAYTGTVVPGR